MDILLFHGFASSRDQTYEQTGWVRSLARAGHTVHAPDLPGHATSSDAAVAPGELLEWARAQVDALVEITGGPIAVGGYSLGSTLAWDLGVQEAEKISAVVLGGVPSHDHLSDLARGEQTPQTAFLENLLADVPEKARLTPLIEGAAEAPFSSSIRLQQGLVPPQSVLVFRGGEDHLALDPEVFAARTEELGLQRPQTLEIEGRDHVTVLTSIDVRKAVAAALG